MDNPYIEIQAASLEEALREAAARSGLPPDRIKYEFVSDAMRADRPTSGPVRIRIIDERAYKSDELKREIRITEMLRAAQEFAENKDGFYKVEVLGDNVYLTVYQHSGKGKQVSVDEIYKKLNTPKYLNLSHQAVKKAMEAGQLGKPLMVATLNPDYKDLDARATLEVAKDRMSVFLKFSPPRGFGGFPKVADIEKLAVDAGIVCELDRSVIENAIRNKVCGSLLLVGKGKQPENGLDTHIDWTVERMSTEKIIYYRPDGSVDFKKIYLLSNVRAKDVIGTLRPSTDGIAGQDVHGNRILSKPGRQKQVSFGKNVALAEDGVSVISQIDGQIKFINGIANVFSVYEIFGDVDYNVGNIEFSGSVTIKGTVLDGFSVKAGGNIYVERAIGEAKLEAEGDIYLPHGFLGKAKGLIKAGKNVIIKFAEGGTIEAQGRVVVDLAIIHSTVTAGERIEVTGKRGQIIGGDLTAGDEIVARTIGAKMGVVTKLNLGFDSIVMERLEGLKNELLSTEKELEKIRQAYNFLTISKARGEKKITGDVDDMLGRLQTTINTLEAKWDYLKNEKEVVFRDITAGRRAEVRAIEVIHGGVVLNIKNVNYYVKTDIKASTLHLEDGEVRVFPL